MCSSGRRGSLVITKSMDWTMKEIKDYETSERNKYEDKLQLYEYEPWVAGHGMRGEPCDLSRALFRFVFRF